MLFDLLHNMSLALVGVPVPLRPPKDCFVHCAAASYDYFGIYFGDLLPGGPTICACGRTPHFVDSVDGFLPGTCENPCPTLPGVSCGGRAIPATESSPSLKLTMSLYRLLDGKFSRKIYSPRLLVEASSGGGAMHDLCRRREQSRCHSIPRPTELLHLVVCLRCPRNLLRIRQSHIVEGVSSIDSVNVRRLGF